MAETSKGPNLIVRAAAELRGSMSPQWPMSQWWPIQSINWPPPVL